MSRRKVSVVVGAAVVATVLAVLLVQVAVARISSPPTTISANGGLVQTKVVRSNSSRSTSGTSWVGVGGMSTGIHVPSGGKAIVVISFTAESDCYSASDSGWCSVRAKVGSKVGEPNEGTDFAWQGGTSADPYEGLAMTRSVGPIGSGNYTVKIEFNGNGDALRLDDMSMVVQVIQV